MNQPGRSGTFWWALLGSTALGITAVSIVGTLISLGVLPIRVGLVFVVVVVAVTVWFGRALLAGETVRMLNSSTPIPKAELRAGAKSPARYIIAFLFGALVLSAVYFFGGTSTTDGEDYFWIAAGVAYIVMPLYGWFRRGETITRLEEESDQTMAVKQKASLVGAMTIIVSAKVFEWLGWTLFPLTGGAVVVGIVAGYLTYRVLLRRYSAGTVTPPPGPGIGPVV